MEMGGLAEESPYKEKNHAFVTEDRQQICMDTDSLYRDTEDAGDREDEKSLLRNLEKGMKLVHACFGSHRERITQAVLLILAAGFIAMVIAACVQNFDRAVGLLVITLIVLFFLAWDFLMERYGDLAWEKLYPIRDLANRNYWWIKWVVTGLNLVGFVCWMILDRPSDRTRQLVSLAGLILFIVLMLVTSNNPCRVNGSTLQFGVGLQFLFGILTLRTEFGFAAMQWVGEQIEIFLAYTDVGSEFVFGESYAEHFFAFKVLPILVFFSAVISLLYYVGIMQWMLLKVGFVMEVTMGTSPVESLAAAGNIFLGQTDALILVRPYMSLLTCSEMNALMTGGLASISSAIMATYISFGIQASHLLTASLMSAPASLAIAKVCWPEVEPTKITYSKIKMHKEESYANLFEAASQGAASAVLVVVSIAVNLIAYLAILAFLDAALSWLGFMFDYPQLSFSSICSYVFMPLTFMMGVSWEDSFLVGELIGLKTFFNEFVAYEKLSELVKLRKAGGPEYLNDVKQYISLHSETIATYALCGFSNLSALGMMVGVMINMVPDRRADIASCSYRSMAGGCMSCFMTACVAGILYRSDFQCENMLETVFGNALVNSSTDIVICCRELYNGVTVHDPWNVTAGGAFSQSLLRGCCAVTPSTHFNCSMVL